MKTIIYAFIAAVVLCAPAQAAQSGDRYDAWMTRCEGSGVARTCEAFQRLTQAQSGQRVLEFAIGYPEHEAEKAQSSDPRKAAQHIAPASKAIMAAAGTDARGVMVLPLGIMLPDGVTLMIDKNHRYKFEVRYCTAEGCYAYIDLPGGAIERLTRGMTAEIFFRTLDKQDVRLPVNLKGLSGALQAIR